MFEGYFVRSKGMAEARQGMDLLATGTVDAKRMTTHTFAFAEAIEAFDLLYTRAGETLGVLLDWSQDDG